jgi:hypothetical protein
VLVERTRSIETMNYMSCSILDRNMKGSWRGMEVDKLELSRDDESGEGKCYLKTIQAWTAKHGLYRLASNR